MLVKRDVGLSLAELHLNQLLLRARICRVIQLEQLTQLLTRVIPTDRNKHARTRVYDCIVYVFLPEWVAIIARCLFSDGVFEDLASVDFLFDTSASDESIHDHVLLLSDAEGSIYSLSVRRWVPTGINCS